MSMACNMSGERTTLFGHGLAQMPVIFEGDIREN
jgi:hypothetical protein